MSRLWRLGGLALPLTLILAAPAWSQALSRDELMEALRQRDASIAALQRRVEALEVEALENERRAPPAPIAPAQPPAPAATVAASSTEDDVALQALSRSLVQRGGLVLPKWSMEAVPGFSYANTLTQGLVLVDTPEGISTVANQRRRTDAVRASATLRVGLPWDSQVEVRVPYVWTRETVALGDGSHREREGSGIGDVEVELSRQLMREHGWRPDLVGAVGWRFPTGRDPLRGAIAAVATGSGTREFRARLTAVKSSDPLVFFSTLSYSATLPVDEVFGRVNPGDAAGLQLGAVLAVNPETSLTFGFAQEFRGQTQVDGAAIPGSDGVSSVLQFGVDRVLTPHLLLDLSLGVGVSRDAPDYVFLISTPYRF